MVLRFEGVRRPGGGLGGGKGVPEEGGGGPLTPGDVFIISAVDALAPD